ncbi:MAG: AsmA family protein [Caulobacteraceae bacterium]
MKNPPVRRRAPLAAAIGGAALLALMVLILLFQWNWLRGPLASVISGQIHRPVRIEGNLKVHPWSGSPWASFEGLTIGNPAWAGGGAMIDLPKLTVAWRWASLLGGKLALPLVRLDNPRARLIADAGGRQNWNFSNARSPPRPRWPAIGRLVIAGGALSYTDAKLRANFSGTLTADETPAAGVSTLAGDLVVGGAPWAGAQPLARAPKLVVRMGLLEAMAGRLTLPLVEADRPTVRLVRDASGRANWQSDPKENPKPLKLPPINHLIVSDGALRYDDAKARISFAGTVSTSETVKTNGQGSFLLQGKGTLNAAPFTARVTGGPLIDVDARRPYPFDARIEAGATRLAASGIIAHPFDFGRVSGGVRVSGPDFSDLYHLTGVALPSTPPYDLAAGFARVGRTYAFRRIAGRIGDSDLAGSLSVDDTRGRPLVTADLASRRLKLADLAAVIGGVPKHTAGHTLSPAQKIMAAKLRAEHRFLPDARLDVSRIRTTDARLTYRAASVDAGKLPIRALSLKLSLDHGLLIVDPLTMGLLQGDLAGQISLDARGAVPREAMDVKLTNARLENLIAAGNANPPLEGGLYGRAKLNGSGDSVRAAAGDANGTVSLVIPGGEIRQSLAELLGIDATKGLFLLLAKSQGETPIRCAVADFRAQNGVLTADRVVLDTGVVLSIGHGDIDLRNETINLKLDGKPKKFRLVRIAAPITIKGPLIAPKFGVEIGKAAGQVMISGVLAAFVSPLALILPFVNPGLAKNADCAALERESESPVARR